MSRLLGVPRPLGRSLGAVFAVVVLLGLGAPAARAAGSAAIAGGVLTYTGDATVNSTQVTVSGANYVVHDFTSTVVAGAGCAPSGSDSLCPTAAVTSIVMEGNGGGDWLRLTTTIAVPVTLNGGAGADTLQGAAAADTISGGTEDDVLDGNGGADTLDGGPGTDTADYHLRAQPVTVTLAGGGADDGEAGEGDTITTCERALGGSGADDLTGSDGVDDVLEGGSGNDQLHGLDGNDTLRGGQNSDVLDGGPGTDTADYTNGFPSTITLDGIANDGGPGQGEADNALTENVIGSAGNDTITGDAEPNRLEGSGGNDTLIGAGGTDTLLGGDGNDVLRGGLGADAITGGNGADTADYSERALAVTASLDGLANDGEPGEQDSIDAEQITGGSGNDHLIGRDAPSGPIPDKLNGGTGQDELDGLAGDDVLEGAAGNDTLNGGAGNDTLRGGTEADVMHGDAGQDLIDYSDRGTAVTVSLNGLADDGGAAEGDNADAEDVTGGSGPDSLTGDGGPNLLRGGLGIDQLNGMSGDDVLRGEGQADVLNGGDGTDTADYSTGAAVITVTLDGVANDGAAGEGDNALVENVIASLGPSTVTGDGGPNVLRGGPSADTLNGGDGDDVLLGRDQNDQLHGGAGDDLLDGGTGNDLLDGGDGRDTADYRTRTAGLKITLDTTANDGTAPETDDVRTDDVLGGQGADQITGDAQANLLDGGGAANQLHGGGGNDTLLGGSSADLLDGGDGFDSTSYASRPGPVTVTLFSGADDGQAGEGDDAQVERVTGSLGADTLTGGPGADWLDGAAGADTLNGGAGDDTIVGGLGGDQLISGTGADRLRSADGEADTLTCDVNSGKDVDADELDVKGSCVGGAATGGGGNGADDPPLPPALQVPAISPGAARAPSPRFRLLSGLTGTPLSGASVKVARGAPVELGDFHCPARTCTVSAVLKSRGRTLAKDSWKATAATLSLALTPKLRGRAAVVATITIKGMGATATVRIPLTLRGGKRA